ncbi:MAG: SDR family oxidoreductase [Spongiibacteraceae bacterium]
MSENKVILITGATSGIGLATARELAAQGHELFLLARNRDKGEAVLAEISEETGNDKLQLLVADLGSMADIRRIAAEFLATGKPLQVLINNAGILNTQRRESQDGIEETFAVNQLGYFLLTELLREKLMASAPSRIVSVASDAYHFVPGVNFDDIEMHHTPYKPFKVYGNAKLCNILWTRELAKQLEGSGVTANCLHPGAVNTGLGHQNSRLLALLLKPLLRLFFRRPSNAAACPVYLATSESVAGVSGEYFVDSKIKSLKSSAKDSDAGEKLWRLCEQYTAS